MGERQGVVVGVAGVLHRRGRTIGVLVTAVVQPGDAGGGR
jgi:hypothetical protein